MVEAPLVVVAVVAGDAGQCTQYEVPQVQILRRRQMQAGPDSLENDAERVRTPEP